jgi:hypothetical protein
MRNAADIDDSSLKKRFNPLFAVGFGRRCPLGVKGILMFQSEAKGKLFDFRRTKGNLFLLKSKRKRQKV